MVDGPLTLVKPVAAAATGLLHTEQPHEPITDEESMQSVMCDRDRY